MRGPGTVSVLSSLLIVWMFVMNSNPAAGKEADITPPIEPRAPTRAV